MYKISSQELYDWKWDSMIGSRIFFLSCQLIIAFVQASSVDVGPSNSKFASHLSGSAWNSKQDMEFYGNCRQANGA